MQELLAAVARQEDEEAERLAQLLTAADEPALVELLTSTNEDERWWAVRGLALVGSQTSIPLLAQRLHDEARDGTRRHRPGAGAAARALRRLRLSDSSIL